MAGTNVCMDCIRSEYRDDTVQKNINAGLELLSNVLLPHRNTERVLARNNLNFFVVVEITAF